MTFAAVAAGVGTAITAGTQIYGAVEGGGDIPGNEAAVAAALKDYKRKVADWRDFWDERIPRMTKNQQEMYKKTSAMLESYKGQFERAFREGSFEKVHRKFVGDVNKLSSNIYTKLSKETQQFKGQAAGIYKEIRGDIDTLAKGELDPKFRQRVTEAEHEINRISADSLNDYVQRNARERAKGGMGFINPERRDELVSGNWARSRDMARGQARSQVEATLAALLGQKQTAGSNFLQQLEAALGQSQMAGQNLIGNKKSLIDDYAGIAQAQRARQMGQLQSNFGFDSQGLRNEAANRGYLDTLLMQQYMDKPERNIPGVTPAQGRSSGQAAMDIGGTVGSLLQSPDMNRLLSQWFGGGSTGNNYLLTPRSGTGLPSPW